MRCRIVIASLRLHKTLALKHVAAAIELSHLGIGIERTVVGVHHSIAIDNLDKIRVDRSLTRILAILGLITIDIHRILIDKHIAIALEALIREAHSTIGRNHCAVVVSSKITNEDKDRRVAIVDKIGIIGNHIHHTTFVILLA